MFIRALAQSKRAWLTLPVLALACLFSESTRPASANHAYPYSQGIGFTQVNSGGWVDVYIHTNKVTESIDAINDWRAMRIAPNRWWLQQTSVGSQAEVEIMDKGDTSVFSGAHGVAHTTGCNQLPNDPDVFARTFASDDTNTSSSTRGWGDSWVPNVGHSFVQVTVCLNTRPDTQNDKGTIGHELGHALGLNHVNLDFQPCFEADPQEKLNSIMAYSYDPPASWQEHWPEHPYTPGDPDANAAMRRPTSADVFGRWVCGTANAGGLAYVYQIWPDYGFPSTINSDEDPFGCSNREEAGGNPLLGGQRNSTFYWDFYDVNFDHKVDGLDIGLVRLNFDASPPIPPEDQIYDRSQGVYEWAPGVPDGVINGVDIGLVRAEFNHTCVFS